VLFFQRTFITEGMRLLLNSKRQFADFVDEVVLQFGTGTTCVLP
jgi:hypothetical protein